MVRLIVVVFLVGASMGLDPGAALGQERWPWATSGADREETAVIAAALDSIVTALRDSSVLGPDVEVQVSETLRVWPFIFPVEGVAEEGFPPVAPAPPMLRSSTNRMGLRTLPERDLRSLIARGGVAEGVVLILGTVDFLSDHGALLRVNLYWGPNGQELLRVRLERGAERWAVAEIKVEYRA